MRLKPERQHLTGGGRLWLGAPTVLLPPVLGTPELVSSLVGLKGTPRVRIPGAPGLGGDVLGCVWEGGRLVAGGSRKEAGNGGSLSTERVKFLAIVQGARIKEPLFSVLGSRQLPPPRSCQCRPPLLASLLYSVPGQGLAQPPSSQTTGSFSSASPDLRVPDLGTVPGRSAVETHTVPFFLFPSP